MTADSASGAAPGPLLRTPLYEAHKALGARLVEFGGWEMPVRYSGDIAEHQAVRQRAGLFDVCHMGEFTATGPGALDFLQSLVPNNVARLTEHQALYTQILRPDGGTLDDLIIYRLGPERYMIVVNAGTMEKDWAWFTDHAAGLSDGHAGEQVERNWPARPPGATRPAHPPAAHTRPHWRTSPTTTAYPAPSAG